MRICMHNAFVLLIEKKMQKKINLQLVAHGWKNPESVGLQPKYFKTEDLPQFNTCTLACTCYNNNDALSASSWPLGLS